MNRDEAQALLQGATGNVDARFHLGPREAIGRLTGQRKKLLVVQRGCRRESMVYFLATRLPHERGHDPSIIVSPLLTLMRNQIEAACRIGMHATTVNSTNYEQADEPASQVHKKRAGCLLRSPGILVNDRFVEFVQSSILVCISRLLMDEVLSSVAGVGLVRDDD